jgi:hypothetical protein
MELEEIPIFPAKKISKVFDFILFAEKIGNTSMHLYFF